MKLVEQRGSLVGALICEESDELYAIASNGVVIRTRVDQVRATGRATMGVSLMDLAEGDSVVGVARSADLTDEDEAELPEAVADEGPVLAAEGDQGAPDAVDPGAPQTAGVRGDEDDDVTGSGGTDDTGQE